MDLYFQQLSEVRIRPPFDLSAISISFAQIETDPATGDDTYLFLGFLAGSNVTVGHIVKGSVETSLDATVVVKPSFWFSLYMNDLLGDQHFQFIEYVVDSAASLVALPDDTAEAGDQLATGASSLKLGFFRETGGVRKYIAPAIIFRVLGYLSSQLLELLGTVVQQDNATTNTFS